jgi:AraC-like DNA-binding protein
MSGIPFHGSTVDMDKLTKDMQKMTRRGLNSVNYFHYLPENRLCASWGCTVTALGCTRILPGSAYPPQRHPDDHHFTWESGRWIDAFQIVQITRGRGMLESAGTEGPQRVGAGGLFLLFPGVWHRYAPDADTGWTEHWVECRGHAFDDARASSALDPHHPLRPATAEVADVFRRLHAWAARDALAHQNVISTLGLQLLALLVGEGSPGSGSRDAALVQRAMAHILEHCHQPLQMSQVARDLNVGYTRFRELFQVHAHTSPKQYHLRLRMNRARDLLLNTEKSLKEIAALLGFHSAFHFSHQFRAAHGMAPRDWRKRAPERPGVPCRGASDRDAWWQ